MLSRNCLERHTTATYVSAVSDAFSETTFCHLSHVLDNSRSNNFNQAHPGLLLLLSPTISQAAELSIHWLYSGSSTAPRAAQWFLKGRCKEDGAHHVEAVGDGYYHRGLYQPDRRLAIRVRYSIFCFSIYLNHMLTKSFSDGRGSMYTQLDI